MKKIKIKIEMKMPKPVEAFDPEDLYPECFICQGCHNPKDECEEPENPMADVLPQLQQEFGAHDGEITARKLKKGEIK